MVKMLRKIYSRLKLSDKTPGVKQKDVNASILKIPFRRIGIFLAKLLVNTRISPNQISFLSFFLVLPASFFFALGDHRSLIIGTIIFFIAYSLDFADGALARLRNSSTNFGAWLDNMTDEYKRILLILSITYGVYRMTQDSTVWILGFLSVTAIMMYTTTYGFFVRIYPNAYGNLEKQKQGSKILKNFVFTGPFIIVPMLLAGLLDIFYYYIWFTAVYGWIFNIALFIMFSSKKHWN